MEDLKAASGVKHPNLCAVVERALDAARVDVRLLEWESAGLAGSGRTYWRISAPDGRSWVLQQSHDQDADWHRFVEYGTVFHGLGLPVPRILAVDEPARQVLQEDLGTERLWDAWHRDHDERHYRDALEALTRWQLQSAPAFQQSPELAAREFDFKGLRWETEYFTEHYLQGKCGLSDAEVSSRLEAFDALAERVSRHPRGLMHRDFQSQNIMIQGGRSVFIDFQGARHGSLYYDAASLLWDPYVMLPAEKVRSLFHAWAEANPLIAPAGPEENWNRFLDASQQRLMQALGAYCNLSRNKGIASFAQHIGPGERRLTEVLGMVK